MRTWRDRAVAVMRRNPSAVLLIAQLAGILLYAFTDDSNPRSTGRLALTCSGCWSSSSPSA